MLTNVDQPNGASFAREPGFEGFMQFAEAMEGGRTDNLPPPVISEGTGSSNAKSTAIGAGEAYVSPEAQRRRIRERIHAASDELESIIATLRTWNGDGTPGEAVRKREYAHLTDVLEQAQNALKLDDPKAQASVLMLCAKQLKQIGGLIWTGSKLVFAGAVVTDLTPIIIELEHMARDLILAHL